MQSGSAREEKRDWEDSADALSLLLSSSSPRSQNTHTLASTLSEGPLPLAAFAVRNWRLSPARSEAGRGGRRVER